MINQTNFAKVLNTHIVKIEITEYIFLSKHLSGKQQGNYKKRLDYAKNLINYKT